MPNGPTRGRASAATSCWTTTAPRGKVEYLERGVAALRAQFPVSPSENWAHVGYGGKAGVSSFHWGTGSGMAGIEIEEEYPPRCGRGRGRRRAASASTG